MDDAKRRRDLTPAEARQRFLARREQRNTDETVRDYSTRLRQFVLWTEEHPEIKTMDDLDGWLIDEYHHHLEEIGNAPSTIKGKLTSLVQLLKYCEQLEIVDQGTHEKVDVPALTKTQATNDEKLDAADARELLQFFRNSTARYGTSEHVTLELIWHVGGRISCFQALDLDDWDRKSRTLQFRHRPPTRLKDGEEHERNVVVPETVADALAFYIKRERPDKRDSEGRRPLLTTTHGRPSGASIRGWAYLATQPCLYKKCPHNNKRGTCEYTHRNHASKCPSSRSPHAIRTGSITWQLNQGLSYVKVAERVAAAPETIRRYYDKPDHEQSLQRRRPETANLDILEDIDDQ